jgi:pyruvate dehydrogenase E1 component alpha subunit
LIEALTYRLADHTTADDASRYRSDDEVSAHWRDDPVARLRALLVHLDVWGREREEALLARCESTIDEAVEAYEATPPMPASAMFDHLHATLPHAYRAQLDEIVRREGNDG